MYRMAVMSNPETARCLYYYYVLHTPDSMKKICAVLILLRYLTHEIHINKKKCCKCFMVNTSSPPPPPHQILRLIRLFSCNCCVQLTHKMRMCPTTIWGDENHNYVVYTRA